MQDITITPETQRRARIYLAWFPTFCASSTYDAASDWPEVAHTVASLILTANVGESVTVANYRADAWKRAEKTVVGIA